ncbi:MAG: hypothetical protein EP348_09130 [Alphaproteobacteria bacterium]|nr:MAG: hypothetical protein EP348_09130 [Alphaproteobacteria bacterium]
MIQNSEIDAIISSLMSDLSGYTEQTRNGTMIDLGTLPGRILEVQGMVQRAPSKDRPRLSTSLNNLLKKLDELSQEIQRAHDDLSLDIDRLDMATGKE